MYKIMLVFGLLLGMTGQAFAGPGFQLDKFQKVFYFEHGGKGSYSGLGAGNAKAIEDTDLMSIDAGSVIEKVYVVIDTAVAGVTGIAVGDDDSANGFVIPSSVTVATPGIYSWNANKAGAYLKSQVAGVSDAADVYVAPAAKYYSAAGKEVKLDVSGAASSAGKFRVVVEGYKLGY